MSEPTLPLKDFCKALQTWQQLYKSDFQFERAVHPGLIDIIEYPNGAKAIKVAPSELISWVFLQITKSCLLDRMIYGKEQPSQTPCPVHKGKWSGIHFIWPGSVWHNIDGTTRPATPDKMVQEWYDQGCRCAYHKCGCTTGWQPDEHCGCGVKP